MSNLYSNQLAKVYDIMYQSFIDYNEEFAFYNTICQKHKAQSILEFACGSGNLSKNFSKSFKDYLGVDLSEDMLKLAKEKTNADLFSIGDMRNFKIAKTFDAVIITGRSTSYLISEEDFTNTLINARNLLNNENVLIFDCIDSEKFLPYTKKNPEVIHEAMVDNNLYYRKTCWKTVEPLSEKLIEWDSKYYKANSNNNQLIGKDKTLFKVFNRHKVENLLNKCGYKMINILERKTYAFETFVIVARKVRLNSI